jgi:hypothetical protein
MSAPDWTINESDGKRLALIQFDDVESAVALALKPPPERNKHEGKTSRDDDMPKFFGASLKDAAKLATLGWPEGRAQIVRWLEAYQSTTTLGADRALSYDVAGFRPDVARAIAGDPLNMISAGPELRTRAPVVSLAMNISVSSGVDGSQIILWGIALASHIDALEAAGYRVDLTITSVNVCRANKLYLALNTHLKAPDQPLDLDRLAYWLAHPSSLRRIMFANYDQRPAGFEHDLGMRGNYGIPADVRKPIGLDIPVARPLPAKLARIVLPETTAYLPSAQNTYLKIKFATVADAIEAMRPCIEAALKLEDVTDDAGRED